MSNSANTLFWVKKKKVPAKSKVKYEHVVYNDKETKERRVDGDQLEFLNDVNTETAGL